MELQLKAIEYLKNNGIKKKHLASVIGVYPSQLSMWLSGEFELTPGQIEKLLKFIEAK